MSSPLYRNYLRLLEKWPVDPTKKGRDLGEYIRTGISVLYRGGSEPGNTVVCEEIHTRLSAIARNRYKEAFYISGVNSSTGLSQTECQQVISNEFLKVLHQENESLKDRLKGYFGKN